MPEYRNNRNFRHKSDGNEARPVSFRDGEPVYGNDKKREQGGRSKPYSQRDGEKKPYYKKDGEQKPYYKKDGGQKPYYKKDGEQKPYYKKDGEQKPYYKKDEEQKPFYKKSDNAEGRFDRRKNEQRAEQELAPKKQVPRADAPNAEADELPYLVLGRNAVREALKSGRSIDKLLISKEPDGSLRELMNMARDQGVRVDEVNREKLDELCMPFGHGGKTANHQGAVAQVPGVEYCEIADMLAAAKEKNEKPFIILLDGIEDPHNLGSIIRSAVCAGAHGVILPRRRAVGVTAAACKASAGAVEHCRIARVANITNALARLKDEGIWIAGADMTGMPMGKARMEGALALVIGSEGVGLSRLVKEQCDFLVSIPMCGPIDSLNASVAAAIIMFEKRRQDGLKKD